ncbi:YadA-like family protein [Sphingomonas arvum]|uniref:YadA-like family protein n=1 Tax=Sphingomonas arvum TaxID=2992113 RepID=UPI0038B28077
MVVSSHRPMRPLPTRRWLRQRPRQQPRWPMEGGRTMITARVGTYGGRSAVAIDASHASDDGRSIFRVGVTYDSNERVGPTRALASSSNSCPGAPVG